MGPGALGMDSSSGTAYVAVQLPSVTTDAGQPQQVGGVVVIDMATGNITTTIQVPGYGLSALAVDSSTHTIYVDAIDSTGPAVDTLVLIDGTTNTLTGTTIPLGAGTFDVYTAVDSSNHHVYGYNGLGHVYVADGAAKSLLANVTLPGYNTTQFGNTNGGLAVDPASHKVWVLGPATVDSSTGTITSALLTVIDGTTNTVGVQTPYQGTPIYLADDTASTGDVFVVMHNPQTVVLDGPVTFQVPPGYTVTLMEPWCSGQFSAAMEDANGNGFEQDFDAKGMPLGPPQPHPSWIGDLAAAAFYDVSGFEVVMVETVVNGTATLLPTLKHRKNPC